MRYNLLLQLCLGVFMLTSAQTVAQTLEINKAFSGNSLLDLNILEFTYVPKANQVERLVDVTATLSLNGIPVMIQSANVSASEGPVVGFLSSPSQTSYPHQFITADMLALGLIPEGSYTLCITVRDGGSQSAECTSMNHVVRMNHLGVRLLYPLDESVVYATNPNLVWTSSILPATDNTLRYEVGVFDGGEVDRNDEYTSGAQMRLFQSVPLVENLLQYPQNATPLDPGTRYHWQVNLYSGNLLVARSQVWAFSLEEPGKLNDYPISASYIDITRIGNLPTYYFLESLKLKNIPLREKDVLEINMTDDKGEPVSLNKTEITFRRDQPYVEFMLTDEGKIKHLKKYKVSLQRKNAAPVEFYMVYLNPLFIDSEH